MVLLYKLVMFKMEQLVSRLAVVNYACKSDHTIAENDDYIPGPYTVTFPAGVTSATFDVAIISDNLLENDETFLLTINQSLLPSRVIPGSPGTVPVSIVDDDSKSLNVKIILKYPELWYQYRRNGEYSFANNLKSCTFNHNVLIYTTL